jgi:hypothetical protein
MDAAAFSAFLATHRLAPRGRGAGRQGAWVARNSHRHLALIAVFASTACTTVSPIQALASTIPIDTTNKQLVYIGNTEGRSCSSHLFFFIPLSSDASVFTSKNRALQAVPSSRRAVALIDVTIDESKTWYVIYGRTCTVVRGKAVAYQADSEPSPAKPKSDANQRPKSDANQGLDTTVLKDRAPNVIACLGGSQTDGAVNVRLKVAKDGLPASLGIAEAFPEHVRLCILDALRGARFPAASADYVINHRYAVDPKAP